MTLKMYSFAQLLSHNPTEVASIYNIDVLSAANSSPNPQINPNDHRHHRPQSKTILSILFILSNSPPSVSSFPFPSSSASLGVIC